MKTITSFIEEQLRNPEFAREYEVIQTKMDVIRAIVEVRNSKNLTQK